MRSIAALWLAGVLPFAAQAQTKACPFKPDELASVFGAKFDAGTEEPGPAGSGCKYRTLAGSLKSGTDVSIWVFQFEPGPNQDMLLKLTLGPGAKPTPVKGDPDGAQEKHGDGIVDVFYKRQGWAVLLRSGGSLGNEAAAMARRAALLEKLPRLH